MEDDSNVGGPSLWPRMHYIYTAERKDSLSMWSDWLDLYAETRNNIWELCSEELIAGNS